MKENVQSSKSSRFKVKKLILALFLQWKIEGNPNAL
jgi:hypothetical protein